MTREVIVEWLVYPDWKSRAKTYFLKIVGLFGGEVWKFIADFEISRREFSDCYDEVFSVVIFQAKWCKVKQVWFARSIEKKVK